MTLKIAQAELDKIRQQSEASYPNECCGFLLGRANGVEKDVLSTVPAENAREESAKYHRFLITPKAYLQCEKRAREEKLDIVGFYHSHPNAEARPSHYDLEHGWPYYSYVIVSVRDRRAGETTSWVLADDRSKFHSENMCIR